MQEDEHTIKKSTLIILLIIALVAGAILLFQNQNEENVSSTTPTETVSQTEIETAETSNQQSQADLPKSTCTGLTSPTTEGPYYITETKQLFDDNLNYDNLPGDPIRIVGYVYQGPDNSKPLSNAKIEIWQADSEGNYHPESNGSSVDYQQTELSLRGYVLTDGGGFYSFTTIYPGEYEGRARHIHVKASSDGLNGVTTQLIMSKDGDKTPATQDNIAQTLPSCNTTTFTKVNELPTAAFDFHIN